MFNSCPRITDFFNLPPRPQNGGHPALPDCVIQAGLEEKAGKFRVLIIFWNFKIRLKHKFLLLVRRSGFP